MRRYGAHDGPIEALGLGLGRGAQEDDFFLRTELDEHAPLILARAVGGARLDSGLKAGTRPFNPASAVCPNNCVVAVSSSGFALSLGQTIRDSSVRDARPQQKPRRKANIAEIPWHLGVPHKTCWCAWAPL